MKRMHFYLITIAFLFTTSLIYSKNQLIKQKRLDHLRDDKYWINKIDKLTEYDNVDLGRVRKTSELDPAVIEDFKLKTQGPYVRFWRVYKYPTDNVPRGRYNHYYSGLINFYGKITVFGHNFVLM